MFLLYLQISSGCMVFTRTPCSQSAVHSSRGRALTVCPQAQLNISCLRKTKYSVSYEEKAGVGHKELTQ